MNYVGTNGDGNHDDVEGNIISGNGHHGVFITNATSTRVAGNFIGTDNAGTIAKQNGKDGVRIENGSKFNYVGTDGNGTSDNLEGNLISGNVDNGVFVSGNNTTNNYVSGNLIGTKLDGNTGLGNGKDGVRIEGSSKSNTIGTDGDGISDQAEGNVISGNTFNGVSVSGNDTKHNRIAGNLIGLGKDGSTIVGTQKSGVVVDLAASYSIIGTIGDGTGDTDDRNIISGNTEYGVHITGSGSKHNRVAGNYIGTNQAGTVAKQNGKDGVLIDDKATFTVIGTDGFGGYHDAKRNVISGNLLAGVRISGVGTSDNMVGGNFIGTDKAGQAAIGNLKDGVRIEDKSTKNRVGTNRDGTSDDDERNLISGNFENGIRITDAYTSDNIIAGNWIGTKIDQTSTLGNLHHGVHVQGASSNEIGSNVDGNDDTAEGNTIAFNSKDGVFIESGTGNSIRHNSIFENGQLGIDLNTDGVTANDRLDADGDANNRQNYPIISSVTLNAAGNTEIGLALDSTPMTTFSVEIFSSPSGDPSGFGEGKTYLGSVDLTTDPTGYATGTFTHTAAIAQNHVITATATNTTTNDTSEFSSYRIQSGTMIDFLKGGPGALSNTKINPVTEALNVSNYVTNAADGTLLTPAALGAPTAAWAATDDDPDNFRLHVADSAAFAAGAASISVNLEVVHNGIDAATGVITQTVTSHTITLDDQEAAGGTDSYRSAFLRLVTDANDDAVQGDQTILVHLGDTVRATYTDTTGVEHVSDLGVGRPAAENDNGANQLGHDIRIVQLNIIVFQNNAGTAPAVTRAQVLTDIADANERFAQSNIRVEATINIGGSGDPGVPRPVALADGYTAGNALNPPNPDETAALANKDAFANTLDVFYVGTLTSVCL